jgi:hypothetical protein
MGTLRELSRNCLETLRDLFENMGLYLTMLYCTVYKYGRTYYILNTIYYTHVLYNTHISYDTNVLYNG